MENESNISLGGTVILHTEALLKAQNEGGRDGVRNFCWLVLYSIVRKRHKETPEQANGDY